MITKDQERRLDAYLKTFEPMRRAKAHAALIRQMRLDGAYMFRAEVAEKLATLPHVRLDQAKGRLYHGLDGHFYSITALTSTLVDYLMYLREHAVAS